jgi:hypothetical protein
MQLKDPRLLREHCREGSKYGVFDYTELKYVCVGGFGTS